MHNLSCWLFIVIQTRNYFILLSSVEMKEQIVRYDWKKSLISQPNAEGIRSKNWLDKEGALTEEESHVCSK